jgi:hypothetical protein
MMTHVEDMPMSPSQPDELTASAEPQAMSVRPGPREQIAVAAFTLAAVLFQIVWLGLPASFLSVALVVSYALWFGGGWRITPGLRTTYFVGIAVFAAHVVEEYMGGFDRALPELFAREPWSDARYLVFVSVWGVLFLASAVWLRAHRGVAVLILIFFVIGGGVGNGALHLGLVALRGGYFPGAWTALPCLVVGLVMLRMLYGGVRAERAP